MKFRKALVRLLLSACALGLVFFVVDSKAVLRALGSVTPLSWFLTFCGFVFLHVCSAFKWRATLSLCGLEAPRSFCLRAYGLGLFANLCLPSLVGGDVLKAGLAIKELGRKEAVLLGAVCDRLADLVALATLTGLGFLLAPAAVSRMDGSFELERNLLLVLAGFVVLFGVALPLFLRRLSPRRLPRKLARIYLGFIRAYRTLLRSPGRALAIFSACLGIQAGFVVVNLLLGRVMGLDLEPLLWFLVWPLAKIAAMAPVSLGGLGVREAAFAALAGRFASEELVVAQSLVWESVLIVGGLVAGLGYLMSRKSTGAAS